MELALTREELTKGLLGRNTAGNGLFLMGARLVHTYQMKFSIDIVYLNQHGIIVELEENLLPNNNGAYVEGTAHIVEFNSGTIQICQIQRGERWHWKMDD
jgi:uncharacterized membrane protein (UPF0127 family)